MTARKAATEPCTCGPTESAKDDDPGCPQHGCTCNSVAAHLVSPCTWGRPRETNDTAPAPAPALEDAIERRDRAGDVSRALEGCEQELERLEDIPSADADDVNAISAAKGYVQRARAALARRFA